MIFPKSVLQIYEVFLFLQKFRTTLHFFRVKIACRGRKNYLYGYFSIVPFPYAGNVPAVLFFDSVGSGPSDGADYGVANSGAASCGERSGRGGHGLLCGGLGSPFGGGVVRSETAMSDGGSEYRKAKISEYSGMWQP